MDVEKWEQYFRNDIFLVTITLMELEILVEKC